MACSLFQCISAPFGREGSLGLYDQRNLVNNETTFVDDGMAGSFAHVAWDIRIDEDAVVGANICTV
jgi:hypothetical protein